MSQLDILLVTPPSRLEVYQSLSGEYAAIEPPVWSTLISKYLLKKGYNVEILDAEADNLNHQETSKKIIEKNPLLTVYMIYGQQPSASTQCMPGGSKTCEIVNQLSNNEMISIVVGTHASALPRKTLEEEPYKYVCQGEGPITIEKLLKNIKFSNPKLESIEGLWFKDSNGRPVGNKKSSMFENLDHDLPGQEWSLLDMNKYKAHNWHTFGKLKTRNKYASLQTSLGCPFKCTFCCINAPFERNTIRFWSPKKILKEIEYLIENYGIYNIKIPDEMFVLNPKQVNGICDEILKRGIGDKLNFWAYARIDTLNDNEMLKKMFRSGFKWLAIGIESSSKHVRDGVDKGKFDNSKIEQVVKKVRDIGFYIGANYIFGLPDDDHDSMNKTLDLSIRINSEWANFYSAMAYPGSQLYNIAKKNNWSLPDDKDGPGWIGYSQHAYETLPLPTVKLKASEVLDFRDKAFNIYFQNSDYLNLIKNSFGEDTKKHIEKMTNHTIKRRHHHENVKY